MTKSREEDQRLFAVLSGNIVRMSLRKVTVYETGTVFDIGEMFIWCTETRNSTKEDETRMLPCVYFFFSVIPHYLFVASGQEIFSAQRPARGFIFSWCSREICSLERQKEWAHARDRTGCHAHAEFKRRDIFVRLSFISGDERFSPPYHFERPIFLH